MSAYERDLMTGEHTYPRKVRGKTDTWSSDKKCTAILKGRDMLPVDLLPTRFTLGDAARR